MNIKEPIVGVPLSILDTLCSSWELDPETGRIRVIGPKIGDYSSEADRNGKEIARLVERKIPTGEKNLNKRKLNIDGEHTGFEDSGNKKKRSENTSDTDEEEEDNEEEDEEVESGDESNAEVEENNKTTTKDFSEEGESTDIDYSKYYPKREKRNKNKAMDIQKFRKRRRNVEEKGLPTSGRNNILTSAVYRQRREDDLNSNLSKRRKSNTQKLLTLELGSQSEDDFSDNRRTKRRQYRNVRRLQHRKHKRNKRSTEFTPESDHERKYNELKRIFKKYRKRTRAPSDSDGRDKSGKIKKVKSTKSSNSARKRQSIRTASEQSDGASDEIKNKEDSRESSADYVPGEPVSFKKGFWRRN
jgi:hypothetical protein